MERLDTFMARANAAYYATRDPFADFTTAPEISQVFGELLGAWAAHVWTTMGSPAPVILAELGPGRGTLMADAIRTIRTVAPAFHAAIELHLVETSPRLRALQAARVDATWHDTADTLPQAPLILLANEFLDALPVRQLVRRGDRWAERWVQDGRFVEQDAPPPDPTGAPDIVQFCEPAERLAAALAARLARDGGAALFLDYGAATGGGDTLQAIRDGNPADPLATPGEADLTAHVDFAALARAAAPAAIHGPVSQGLFLARLGLHRRIDRLAQGQPPGHVAALLAAAQRLTEPAHMGRLFQAMALTHPDLPTPSGFTP